MLQWPHCEIPTCIFFYKFIKVYYKDTRDKKSWQLMLSFFNCNCLHISATCHVVGLQICHFLFLNQLCLPYHAETSHEICLWPVGGHITVTGFHCPVWACSLLRVQALTHFGITVTGMRGYFSLDCHCPLLNGKVKDQKCLFLSRVHLVRSFFLKWHSLRTSSFTVSSGLIIWNLGVKK